MIEDNPKALPQKERVVRLIDSIINIAEELRAYDVELLSVENTEVYNALKDLHENTALFQLMKFGPFNKRILSDDDLKLTEAIRTAHATLKKHGKID